MADVARWAFAQRSASVMRKRATSRAPQEAQSDNPEVGGSNLPFFSLWPFACAYISQDRSCGDRVLCRYFPGNRLVPVTEHNNILVSVLVLCCLLFQRIH